MAYAIALLVAGIVLAVMELLIPSGGILGVLSALCFIGSLVFAFQENTTTGLVFITVVVVLLPVLVIGGLKLFPRTPVGRRVILAPAVETSEQRGSAGVDEEDYTKLLGRTGIAITPLRPSGIAEIDGERYSVVTEGDLIDDNVTIEVVKVEGNSIVVDQKTG